MSTEITLTAVRNHFENMLKTENSQNMLDEATRYLHEISFRRINDEYTKQISEDTANRIQNILESLQVEFMPGSLINDCYDNWYNFIQFKDFKGTEIKYQQIKELSLENIEHICKVIKHRPNAVFYVKDKVEYTVKFTIANQHHEHQQSDDIYQAIDADFANTIIDKLNDEIKNHQLKFKYEMINDIQESNASHNRRINGNLKFKNGNSEIKAIIEFNIIDGQKAIKTLNDDLIKIEKNNQTSEDLQSKSLFDFLSEQYFNREWKPSDFAKHGISVKKVKLDF